MRKKGRKGEKVRIGKERIWIEDRWFYWLDGIENVRDGKGRKKEMAGGGEKRQ